MTDLLLTLDEKVRPGNAALIVVDVQNDFIADGGFAAKVGWNRDLNKRAAGKVAEFLPQARKHGVPVIFIQSSYDDIYIGKSMRERNIRRGLELPRCLEGTWGQDFYAVEPTGVDHIVKKHRYDAFFETDLATILRSMDVETLILAGVYTEGCVESTARHGYFLDYYIVMLEDCCGTTSHHIQRDAMERCEHNFGTVVNSQAVARCWSKAPVAESRH